MTATFQGVNIDLHGFLDFARTENENPGHPVILIINIFERAIYVSLWIRSTTVYYTHLTLPTKRIV